MIKSALFPMMSDLPDLKGLAVLIADNDPRSARGMERSLHEFGAEVLTAADSREALAILRHKPVQVIVAAIDFMDDSFIGEVGAYKAANPDSFLYVLIGEDEAEPATDSSGHCADDYIRKPVDAVRFARMVETSIGRPETGSTSLAVIEPLVPKVKPYFIFRSPAMRSALYNLPEIAASGQTVLLSGETGTGKELVARAVHVLSSRASGPFVPINCGAIPESLIEGELFGHEKGAFTGAYATRKGKFEAAHRGTLFLDEIGDMPLNLQVRLLRVLEERKVYRIGAEAPLPIDVRVIAATAVELEKAVSDGLFREDLYYRLNVLRIHLPPLRERTDDIPLLALHFLERAFAEMGRVPPYPSLSPETIYLLQRLPWKGNVRELRNIMTRIATLLPYDTKRIFPFHILPHIADQQPRTQYVSAGKDEGFFISLGTSLDQAEELMIHEALKKTGGNRTKAAKILGISLRTLRRKLNKNN
jgi:DNA-binding NtrC family response regulator